MLSHDKQNEPDVLTITGASAALHISDVVWAGPIAGIRVARVDGEFVAFPTWDQMQRADDYQVAWDGKNEEGQDVASGVYLYKLDTGSQSDRRKMVVIR